VTLRFLGNIAREAVVPLVERVGATVLDCESFTGELARVELFPTPRRPRIFSLALVPETRWRALAQAVERGVQAAGFPREERSFRAHLTLGRLRSGTLPAMLSLPEPVAVVFPVREVVLFESELHRSGARYTACMRVPLAETIHPNCLEGE